MVKFELKVDDREVRMKFDRLHKTTPDLSRLTLGRLGEAVRARSVEHYLSGDPLKRRSGKLAQSIGVQIQNDFRAEIGTNLIYAAIHEFGGTIKPQNAQYLQFKTDTGWARVKEVHMPKRPYLAPALQDVFERTNEGQQIIDRTTAEWLNREFER